MNSQDSMISGLEWGNPLSEQFNTLPDNDQLDLKVITTPPCGKSWLASPATVPNFELQNQIRSDHWGTSFKTQQNPRKSSTFKRIQLTIHPQGSAFQPKSWDPTTIKTQPTTPRSFCDTPNAKARLVPRDRLAQTLSKHILQRSIGPSWGIFFTNLQPSDARKKRTFTGFSPHKLLFKWPSKPYQIELAQIQKEVKRLKNSCNVFIRKPERRNKLDPNKNDIKFAPRVIPTWHFAPDQWTTKQLHTNEAIGWFQVSSEFDLQFNICICTVDSLALLFCSKKRFGNFNRHKESSQKASHQNPSKHSPRIKWHSSGQTKSAPQLWWKKSGQPVDMENIRMFHFCIGVHMQQVVQDFLCKGWKSKVAHWSTWSICGDVLVTPTLVSPVASVCLTQTWITYRKVTCVPPIGGFK